MILWSNWQCLVFFLRREGRCTGPPAASLHPLAAWIDPGHVIAPNHGGDLARKNPRSHGGHVLLLPRASQPHPNLLHTPSSMKDSSIGNMKRRGKRGVLTGVLLLTGRLMCNQTMFWWWCNLEQFSECLLWQSCLQIIVHSKRHKTNILNTNALVMPHSSLTFGTSCSKSWVNLFCVLKQGEIGFYKDARHRTTPYNDEPLLNLAICTFDTTNGYKKKKNVFILR